MYWKTIFASLAFFFLPARGGVNLNVTENIGSATAPNWQPRIFTFSDIFFQQFYQCLCEKETQKCRAVSSYTNLTHHVYQEKNWTKEFILDVNTYECSYIYSSSFKKSTFGCQKQIKFCNETKNYQYFRFTNSIKCELGCIGITDAVNGPHIIPDNPDKRFQFCDDHECNRHSYIKTTEKTSPTKPTTRNNKYNPRAVEITSVTQSSTFNAKEFNTEQVTTSYSDLWTSDTTTDKRKPVGKENNQDKITLLNMVGVVIGPIIAIGLVFIIAGIVLWIRKRRKRIAAQAKFQPSNAEISVENINIGDLDDDEIQPYGPSSVVTVNSATGSTEDGTERKAHPDSEPDTSNVYTEVQKQATAVTNTCKISENAEQSHTPQNADSMDTANESYQANAEADTSNVYAEVHKQAPKIKTATDMLEEEEQTVLNVLYHSYTHESN